MVFRALTLSFSATLSISPSLSIHSRYDPNGNLIQTDRQATTTTPGPRPPTGTISPTDDWQTTLYTYTLLDQLASITDDLGNTTTYTYDAAPNFIQRTTPANQAITHVYDALDHLDLKTTATDVGGFTASMALV